MEPESINAIVAPFFPGLSFVSLGKKEKKNSILFFFLFLLGFFFLLFNFVWWWFYRRDSFITHRAFCDALAEESARTHNLGIPTAEETETTTTNVNGKSHTASPPPPPLTPSTGVVSPGLSIQSSGVLII